MATLSTGVPCFFHLLYETSFAAVYSGTLAVGNAFGRACWLEIFCCFLYVALEASLAAQILKLLADTLNGAANSARGDELPRFNKFHAPSRTSKFTFLSHTELRFFCCDTAKRTKQRHRRGRHQSARTRLRHGEDPIFDGCRFLLFQHSWRTCSSTCYLHQ